MCPKCLSSSSVLVYLIASILYLINAGNLSDAAPLGQNFEEKDHIKSSLIDSMNSIGDDQIHNINQNKYYKLFLRNLLMYDSGDNNDETVKMININPLLSMKDLARLLFLHFLYNTHTLVSITYLF